MRKAQTTTRLREPARRVPVHSARPEGYPVTEWEQTFTGSSERFSDALRGVAFEVYVSLLRLVRYGKWRRRVRGLTVVGSQAWGTRYDGQGAYGFFAWLGWAYLLKILAATVVVLAVTYFWLLPR